MSVRSWLGLYEPHVSRVEAYRRLAQAEVIRPTREDQSNNAQASDTAPDVLTVPTLVRVIKSGDPVRTFRVSAGGRGR